MDFSLNPKRDEERAASRQLYRAGQTPPTPKPSVPGMGKSSLAKSKSFAAGKSDKPSLWKRYRRGLLAILALLLLGSVSYSIFAPNRVKDASKDLSEVFKDSSLTREQRGEKIKEITSNLSDKEKRDVWMATFKAKQVKDSKKLHQFFKLSQEEQVAELKKRIAADEKRNAERQARRAANGGNRGGAGAGRGGAGGAGGAGGGGAGGGGAGGGGGPGGGRGGAGVAGAGNGGGPGGGGPGGGGRGGPGGPGGGQGDNHARAKNFLDNSSPEGRAERNLYRGMNNQVRQEMGLPPSSGRGGFGGGFGGPPGGGRGGPPGGGGRRGG